MYNPNYSFEEQLPPHSKAILQACRAGDLAQLQQILKDYSIKPSTSASWGRDLNGPPNTRMLLEEAVSHQHASIVRFLLSIDPSNDIDSKDIGRSLVESQNLEILELIRARAPDIVNVDLSHFDTFLSAACQVGGTWDNPPGDESLPLVHYLLDNGADPNEGGFGGCGSIPAAIEFSRPLEIIDKMVEKGGVVNLLVFSSAVRARRIDALHLFFDKAPFSVSIDDMLKRARESEDKQIMAIAERGVAKVRKRHYRRKSKWWKGLQGVWIF
ncbi:uncharacterized protein APUU_22019A [Aspergillus puulaauensis]|uniref:Ankyrin repeat-containing domain protein n=1 Tax=Aspergillus puulaauensis TaxID=1220207 RepID=A0A7R7XHT9_9EURO|nr:uncharacterized protein APUU_22019A [Aspergillus puulaauensis]BCS21587.1 hypothetical protein APUU_22019A [Aspergillus puulaauensis]